jgi:hypothetical protein
MGMGEAKVECRSRQEGEGIRSMHCFLPWFGSEDQPQESPWTMMLLEKDALEQMIIEVAYEDKSIQ